MNLEPNNIHIWSGTLACSPNQEQQLYLLLSPDEQQRADRFRFPEHRRRFIVARATLRQILSIYTGIEPRKIVFVYGDHGKPALSSSALQFNLAHSDDLAVYAIADQPVGIDIEKMKDTYEAGLPERFFSPQECQLLAAIPEKDRVVAFYQIWAKKEAIIKASGKGLAVSLASFSVSPSNMTEKIQFGNEAWFLHLLEIEQMYASALASQYPAALLYYHFADYKL